MEATAIGRQDHLDLGPGYTVTSYEDGYVHFHVGISTGGRGGGTAYLKLRPSEARRVADSLRAAALVDDEGVA
jgi:hypothetical protein